MAKRQNTFLIKRSNVPGKVPTSGDLMLGELALNTADVILYTSGTTSNSILPIGWDRLSTISGGTIYAPVTIDSNLTVYSGFTFINGASDGYILTSDPSGNASWEPLTVPGTSAIYSNTSNFTSGVTKTITHNLNTTNVLVQTIDTNTNELIYTYVDNYQVNSVDVTLNETLNNIKVVVAGGVFVEITGATTSDTYTTGATLNGNTIEFNRNDLSNAYSVDLTPILSTGGTSVTAFTYNNSNTLTISSSNGSSYSATINTVTGLTVNGDVTFNEGSLLNPDYIDFNISYTGNTIVEGRMYWDEDNGTISLGLHDNEVLLQLGQENLYYIKNQSGATIENGRVVRASGTLGTSGRILGEYMIADGSIEGKYTLGVATQDILNGADGYVTEFGLVRDIDTTGSLYGEIWSDGDILYVSPTIAGGLTNVRPQSPNINIEIGIIVYSNANGSIFVRPHRYPRVSDLQNVTATGATDGDLLLFDGVTWINSKTLNGSYTITGNTTIGGGLTANTVSATTYYGDGSNLTGINDFYVTGGTYSNGTLTLNRQNGSLSISGFSTGNTSIDTYVTGFTKSDGLLTISQNGGQSPLTASTIESRSISFNSNDMALNTASRVTLTPLVMSVTRFVGLGAVDDAGISFMVPQDYLNTPQFYYTWRASTTSANIAKISMDIYSGTTNNLGSLTTSVETLSLTGTPTTANVFLFSPTASSSLTLNGGDNLHVRIYRDPGDAGDTFTGDLDMINFTFKYNSKS